MPFWLCGHSLARRPGAYRDRRDPHDQGVDSTVTVIGAGIAGIACARAVHAAGRPVTVVDRGRRPGGRIASKTMHGRVVDIGASYFTASDGSPFAARVADWVDRGLARPWTDSFAVAGPDGLRDHRPGPVRYAAPHGLRSLIEDLAAGLDLSQDRTVEHVAAQEGTASVDGRRVATAVLAMPDPQARRLLPAELADRLLGAEAAHGWRPALAVVLGWEQRRWPADLHGAFVHDDPVLEWIADDGDRRGDGAAVVVAHTTPEFANGYLDGPEAAIAAVATAVARALTIGRPPSWTAVHRWTFAKPADPRPEPFGLVDGVGACGDGWSAPSKVESAWTSGDALGRALAARSVGGGGGPD